MKASGFVLFLILSASCFGQEVIGIVTTDAYQPLANVVVWDSVSNQKDTTDASGGFGFQIQDSANLQILHDNYEVFYRKIGADEIIGKDSIFLFIELDRKIQNIAPVIVRTDKLQVLYDERNVNVVDFLPISSGLLLLLKDRQGKFLRFESEKGNFWEVELGKIKVTEIYQDCFENIHLVSQDSAYQMWFEGEAYIVNTISIQEFNRQIVPCVQSYDSQTVFQNFSKRNKKYNLTSIENGTGEKEFLYTVFDTVGEQVARSYYYSIIRDYMMNTPEWKNVITLGVWTGNLMEISGPNQYNWYTKIRAAELNIHAFGTDSLIYVFDQFTDSIAVFDLENNLIQKTSYPFTKSSKIYDVTYDPAKQSFYEVTTEKGVYTFHEIDVFDPSQRDVFSLKEAPLAKNWKLYNGWIYFINRDGDYYRLYRKASD